MEAIVEGAPIEILLVEDSPGDVRLTQEALRDAKVKNRLHTVGDGEAAMNFLKPTDATASQPRPDLILLDLNLPKMDGREVLQSLKADTDLARIPVVVLTTSDAERDVLESYELHANCYITKPVTFDRFAQVIAMIEEFWLTVVRLPPR